MRQGGVLSPLLFIIYMDKCFRDVANQAQEETFANVDDIVIVTDSPGALQIAVNRWQDGMARSGMKINTRKTEVMALGRELEKLSVDCNEERLMERENFDYLGININKRNLNETEINKRIEKYNANINALYPILKHKHVPTKCKFSYMVLNVGL